MKYILISILVGMMTVNVFAQSDTITNADLEKFREKRLVAEKDLRENYAKLGFPSPAELERQNEEAAKDRAERAEKYRQARMEREAIDYYAVPSDVNLYFNVQTRRSGYNAFYGAYVPQYYGNAYRNRTRHDRSNQPGYISNPVIRNTWLRQSAPMRETYRGNFSTRKKPNR